MNKILLLIILFLFSCTTNVSQKEINFSDEMTIEEFRIKIESYAKNNPYPNIDD